MEVLQSAQSHNDLFFEIVKNLKPLNLNSSFEWAMSDLSSFQLAHKFRLIVPVVIELGLWTEANIPPNIGGASYVCKNWSPNQWEAFFEKKIITFNMWSKVSPETYKCIYRYARGTLSSIRKKHFLKTEWGVKTDEQILEYLTSYFEANNKFNPKWLQLTKGRESLRVNLYKYVIKRKTEKRCKEIQNLAFGFYNKIIERSLSPDSLKIASYTIGAYRISPKFFRAYIHIKFGWHNLPQKMDYLRTWEQDELKMFFDVFFEYKDIKSDSSLFAFYQNLNLYNRPQFPYKTYIPMYFNG
jgi:hypothetical protein